MSLGVIDPSAARSHTRLQKLQNSSDFCNPFCNFGCKTAPTYHDILEHTTTFCVIHDHGIYHGMNSSVAFATSVAKPA